jgi:7-dehydrocholesterol reductase
VRLCQLSPFVVWFFLWSCAEHDCSLSASGSSFVHLLRTDPAFTYSYLWNVSKIVTSEATTVWLVWLAAQALLYTFMPGPQDHGQPTPAGHTLRYVVNGLNVWITTHLTVVALLCVMGYEAATIVPRNWMGLFWVRYSNARFYRHCKGH